MLALVVILLAQGPVPNPAGPIFSSPSLMSNGAFFEFAPASGAGLPYAQDLCSYAQGAGLLAGNYWCTRGDGTALAGAPIQVATASGSPPSASIRVCPGGPDCTAKPSFRTPGATDGYSEAADVNRSATVSTGGVSVCYEGIFGQSASEQEFMSLSRLGSAANYMYIMYAAPGSVSWRVGFGTSTCGGAGGGTVTSGTSLTTGVHHLLCATWAASDGIWRLYTDGVASGTSASQVTLCGGATNSRHTLGGYWSGAITTPPKTGATLGGFYSDTQLSAGQITSLANAVLARNPTGAKGEAPNTFTRAGSYLCESSTVGAGSIVPANVPCISQNGFGSFTQTVNLAQYYNALATAPWTPLGAGVAAATVTNSFAIGGTGILDATRVQAAACPGAGNASVVYQNYTGTAAEWTSSCYLRGNGASGNISLYAYDSTASAGTAKNCAFANGVTSRCTVTRTYANATHRIGIGCVNDASVTGSGNTGAADVLVWGCQSEVGAVARPVVPTVNASATKAADPGLLFTLTSAVGPNMCMAGSVQFISSAVGTASIVRIGDGSAQAVAYRNSNTTAGYVLGTVATTTPTVPAMGTTLHRTYLADNAGTRTALWDTSSVTAPAASMASGKTATYIGVDTAGGVQTDGWVSRVQVDPSPTRCAP